jgi:hypothetical protein
MMLKYLWTLFLILIWLQCIHIVADKARDEFTYKWLEVLCFKY